MNLAETAWLAGLLEGEGCFYLQKAKGRMAQDAPSLRLVMTDVDIISRVAVLIDANVGVQAPRYDGCKVVYRVTLLGWPALDVMQAVRPFMGLRRGAKIDELVAGYRDVVRRDSDTCRRGHSLDGAYVTPSTGRRRCRQCHSEWRQNHRKVVEAHG